MTSLPDRQHAVALIAQAQRDGARLDEACDVLKLSMHTVQRWTRQRRVTADQRPVAPRPTPRKTYSRQERQAMARLCNQPEYCSRPPAYIVADQLDQGHYVASESTLYRVLRERGQMHHRGRQKAPQRKRQPTTHQASGAQSQKPAAMVRTNPKPQLTGVSDTESGQGGKLLKS